MSQKLKELLEKIDAGWTPAPLEPQEDLRRRRAIIETLIGKMLDLLPGCERSMMVHGFFDDGKSFNALVSDLEEHAEIAYPGLADHVEKLITEYEELADKVPGASPTGGAS